MPTATLTSVQVGMPTRYGDESAADPFGRPWATGFYKEPVVGPVDLGATQLAGDGQADRVNHGGPDKAVCVYSADHYPYWRETLALDLPHGAFGENFSVAGLAEPDVCIGDVWALGDATGERARVQVSQPRQPCWKLARRWRLKTLTAQVVENGRTGWYFRVLAPGTVAAGMTLTLLERPCPEWTIARANECMYGDALDRAAAKQLAYLPQLSASWREHFMQRYGELA
jgi:MOSC domain-containing protein YiiM